MTTILDSIMNVGLNNSAHEVLVGAETHFFNDALLTPIQKAGSENNEISTFGFGNLFDTASRISQAPTESVQTVEGGTNRDALMSNGSSPCNCFLISIGGMQALIYLDDAGNLKFRDHH